MGEMRNEYRILIGKSEGKSPLGRHKRRWENNFIIGLKEIGWEGVWTGCVWLRIGTSGRLL
jgi:hypothetical protein